MSGITTEKKNFKSTRRSPHAEALSSSVAVMAYSGSADPPPIPTPTSGL